MKKAPFILPLIALGLASCTSDEPANPGNENQGEANYLSVNLVSTPQSGSRAADDNPKYEDGVGDENKVDKVLFYFFDEDGNAAKVKKVDGGAYVNYYLWKPQKVEEGNNPNVDKIINATLVLESSKEDKEPVSIVAVLNPKFDAKELSLDQLNAELDNYAATMPFVMSNSIYAQGISEESGTTKMKKMEAVNILGKIYRTATDAKNDPVIIYVERTVAKVRVSTTLDINKIDIANPNNQPEFNGKKLYAKFLGWNVTATADTARLMKEINPEWKDEDLFGTSEPWNFVPYFRSFWAVNPTGIKHGYGSFDTEKDSTAANAIKVFNNKEGNINYTYVNENASDDYTTGSNPKRPTKVIIAAQLVYADGSPAEFAEWAFDKYELNDLKKAYAEHSTLYKRYDNEGSKTYIKMVPEDIELKTAHAVAPDEAKDEENSGRYKTYAQLAEGYDVGDKYTWTIGNKENAKELKTIAEVNQHLKNLGAAKVWKDGKTYYFLEIEHLGRDENKNPLSIGVVRNHLYDIKIKSVTGLGTPVYDPNEVIYPEKPGKDDSFIAAEINILSWRVVNQDISLEW